MLGYLVIFLIFLLGTAVGSFVNAFEYRLKQGEAIVNSRSHCPHCHHILVWFDLIPLLSFVFLRGRCRYCGKKISWQYPVVELATGILFVLAFFEFANYELRIMNYGLGALPRLTGWNLVENYRLSPTQLGHSTPQSLRYLAPQLLFAFFIISCLEIVYIYDLKYGLIPDEVTLSAALVTVLYRIAPIFYRIANYKLGIMNDGLWFKLQIFNPLVSAVGAGLFFLFLIAITHGRGMGGGDVKLAFLIGLVLGFPGVVIALYLAFISGALVSVFLLVRGKKKFGQTIPFGPFLAAATMVILLV